MSSLQERVEGSYQSLMVQYWLIFGFWRAAVEALPMARVERERRVMYCILI